MNICRAYETKDKKEKMFKLCELEIGKPFPAISIKYLPIDLSTNLSTKFGLPYLIMVTLSGIVKGVRRVFWSLAACSLT